MMPQQGNNSVPQWKADEWALSILQNDNLLASQQEPRHNLKSGCRLLALRVFEQAWEDFIRFHPAHRRGRHGGALHESARRYFESDDNSFLSFTWTCDVFDWEPEWVRRKLLEYTTGDKPLRAIRQMGAGRGPGKIAR